ncbi:MULTISPECIES: SH3 domain-containing protein, partial [unclassified Mameliella]
CRLASASARVINVNDFVNLRAAPGLRAPIVGQLRLAERVQVPDTGRLVPLRDSQRGQTCLNICSAFAAEPQAQDLRREAEGCIAENMLWYQVVASDGNTGFVSRHFLAE